METAKLLKYLPKLLAFTGVVITAAIFRLLPHPPNVAPITALALFSGAGFGGIYGSIIALSSMLASDLFLGFHSTMVFVYASFILIAFLGKLLQKSQGPIRLLSVSFLSSILFFLITNFGVWLNGTMYSKNLSGLMESYLMGLPFFRNTIIGDLLYTFTFFAGYELIIKLVNKFTSAYRIKLSSSTSTE